jgi:hypothetical protein
MLPGINEIVALLADFYFFKRNTLLLAAAGIRAYVFDLGSDLFNLVPFLCGGALDPTIRSKCPKFTNFPDSDFFKLKIFKRYIFLYF